MAVSYFINRKQTVCIVTLKGTLTSLNSDDLQKCLAAALAEGTKYVILNMGGISEVEPEMKSLFMSFQSSLRSSAKLLLCDIRPQVMMSLKAEGVIRGGEVVMDLMSSLQLILQMEKE